MSKKAVAKKVSEPVKKEVHKQVYRAIKTMSETKYTNIQYGIFSQLSGGVSTTPLDATALIVAGTSGVNRIGNEIRIQNLEWMCQTTNTGAADAIGRYILFRWKAEALGTPPAVADILDNGPSGGPDINSLYNYNNRKSYEILVDEKKIYVSGSSAMNRTGMFKKKVFGKKLQFLTQYDVGSASGYNHIYTMFLGSVAVSPTLSTVSTLRIGFKDS